MSSRKQKKFYIALISILVLSLLVGFALGRLIAMVENLKKIEHFTDFNPALPTKILDINGELITEFASTEKREIIALNELPSHMIQALLTREDNTFYQHRGFTIKAIARAVYGKLTRKSLGGGSSLTQQLAGTLYLDRSDISIKRKVKELWWALQLERRYSKNEIIELYLNKMYFGCGTYGVNAASKFYFGHPASEITPAEACLLVIQLSNPAYYNPFEYPNRAMERQTTILGQMVEHGYLTSEVAEESFNEYWANFDYTRTGTSVWLAREDKARWFSEYVLRELTNLMYGTMDIYSDGYTVHTTLNLEHQAAAEQVMQEYIATANRRFQNSSSQRFEKADEYANLTELLSLTFDLPSLAVSEQRLHVKTSAHYRKNINPIVDMLSLVTGLDSLKIETNKANAKAQKAVAKTTVEGTLISIDNDTGYITALVGGSKFDQSNQLIRATQALVQPGSTFKPLFYSAAIDTRKYTASSLISDTPVVFFNEDGKPYTPLNFRGEWKGTVLLWEALATSMNVPSIRILDGIGFDAAINRSAALLGITGKDKIERTFPRVYPLGLGVISIAPIQMAKAFATFANQGKEVTPIAIRSVEDRNGKTIIDPEKELRLEQKRKGSAIQTISPQNAYIMTDLLKNTIKVGTLGWASGYERKFTFKDKNGKSFVMPAGGKTGTTQNWADAWAVGFTPYYTTAVWFGFDSRGFSLGLDNTGATLAGPAWGDFMNKAHQGLPYRDFIMPQTGLVTATVCATSGLLPTDKCTDGRKTFYYLEGTQPSSYCEYHENSENLKRLAIDRLQTESLATGHRSVEVDTTSLLLDPSIFIDPEPSIKIKSFIQETEISDTLESELTLDPSLFDDSLEIEESAEPTPAPQAFNPLLD